MGMVRNCVFCDIVADKAPADVVATWNNAIAITPLNPVVSWHVIVLPKVHVADAGENPKVTAYTMERAAELAKDRYLSFNIITSKGVEATQSVFHLHVHIVPRETGDGLLLPWG